MLEAARAELESTASFSTASLLSIVSAPDAHTAGAPDAGAASAVLPAGWLAEERTRRALRELTGRVEAVAIFQVGKHAANWSHACPLALIMYNSCQ